MQARTLTFFRGCGGDIDIPNAFKFRVKELHGTLMQALQNNVTITDE